MFMLHPVAIAGVTPTILSFALASSSRVCPKTSWYLGGSPLAGSCICSPVLGSYLPGAWYSVGFSSAFWNPFPLMVCRCSSFGPFMSLICLSVVTSSTTLCPSLGPKYLMFIPSKTFCWLVSRDFSELLNLIIFCLLLSFSMPHFTRRCEVRNLR